MKVPAELRSSVNTVSFLNQAGKTEKWEFGGGSWAVAGFEKVGAGRIGEIERILCTTMLNGDGIEFYNDDNWDNLKSPYLDKDTGEYKYYPGAEGYFYVTPFIPCYEIKTLKFKGKSNTNTALCVFYDFEQNKIPDSIINGTGETEKDINVEDGAYFARFCGDVRTSVEISVVDSVYKESNRKTIQKIISISSNNEKSIKNNEYNINSGGTVICTTMLDGEGNEYYEKSGWITANACFLEKTTGLYKYYPGAGGNQYVTPIIPCKGISSLYFSGKSANNTALCVQFDAFMNIVKVIDSEGNVEVEEKEIPISSDVYFAQFCGVIDIPVNISLKKSTYKEFIRKQLFIRPVENSIRKQFDSTIEWFTSNNLLEVIKETAGLTSIFHEWGFNGDSLSSGANYDPYGFAESNIFTEYAYSWCQRLMHLIGGANGANYSVPGWTTRDWITNVWNNEHEAYYTTNGKTEKYKTNKKQAYTLFFGTNDAGISVPVPVGDTDTDIDFDDFNGNADTFAGNYAGIIQRTKSIQPSAKIFVITVPSYFSTKAEDNGYNDVVRKMPELFDNVFLVDIQKYTPYIEKGTKYSYGGHMDSSGYQWFSWMIATYIDYIIRNNLEKFRYVTIIGTKHDKGDL